jgi:hypothetical protein
MHERQAAVAELLRQMAHGDDFDTAEQMLKRIAGDTAISIPEGCPYSIATNVGHAENWQHQWLNQLKGLPKFNVYRDAKDFPAVSSEEWPEVRRRFLEGIQEAYALALAEPFTHHLKDDEAACKKLTKIALHNTYHLGQVKLMKRILSARHKAKP